jgi:hypothetical protein
MPPFRAAPSPQGEETPRMSDPFNPTRPADTTPGSPMGTPTGTSTGSSMGSSMDPTNDPGLRRAGEDLRQAASAAREAAGEAASTVASEASAAAGTLKQEGAALLGTARERAEEVAREGTRAGAAQAEGVARAIHRAADELERESPQLARWVHDAAGSIDGVARAFRDRSPREMMASVEDFARRQPIAFFGVAALAGFAVSRFARSSAMHRSQQGYGGSAPGYPTTHGSAAYGGGTTTGRAMGGSMAGGTTSGSAGSAYPSTTTSSEAAAGAPGWVAEEGGTPRPATLASASLGGAAAYRPRGGSENG